MYCCSSVVCYGENPWIIHCNPYGFYNTKESLNYCCRTGLIYAPTTLYYVLTMGISSNKLKLLYAFKAYMSQFDKKLGEIVAYWGGSYSER